MGYLQSSTPDVPDLVRAAEDRLLGAVDANSHHVMLPVSPYHCSATWPAAETSWLYRNLATKK